MKKSFLLILVSVLCHDIFAQSDKTNPNLFLPRSSMVAYHTATPVDIDGDVTGPAWQAIPWIDDFQDITGDASKPPFYQTQFKLLWDDQFVYIAVLMKTPDIWTSIDRNDAPLYFNNALELFADPDGDTHNYFELEINAFNKVMDMFLPKPYRNGGQPLLSWDLKGWQHEVKFQGTLNNGNDKDTSWSVEMALPISSLTNSFSKIKDGDIWRMNFFRVVWDIDFENGKYTKRKDKETGKPIPAYHWTWSPQGLNNIHYPERWGYVQFLQKSTPDASDKAILPPADKWTNFIWRVYYNEQDYFNKNKTFTSSFSDLDISSQNIEAVKKENNIRLENTSQQFLLTVSALDSSYIIQIDQDGNLQIRDPKKPKRTY